MIICKRCSHEGEYKGRTCPSCNGEFIFSDEELAAVRERLAESRAAESIADVAECLHILADSDDIAAMREFALILESGRGAMQDLDGAMKYFRLAAQKNDPLSAYRFSKLISRTSDRAGRFWLLFSAIIGCAEAYIDSAELLDREGNHAAANYFFSLAAGEGNTDAAVTMARRHLEGELAEGNEAYAKWYLSHLSIPPIHALRMAYKLRSVVPEEPPRAVFNEYENFLRRLAATAKGMGALTAYFRLTELLANEGQLDAKAELGRLYATGEGCKSDIDTAVKLMEEAALYGSREATAYLADIYLAGELVPRDVARALDYYKLAGERGDGECYEKLADIYCDGKHIKRDIAYAIELYDMAASMGVDSARHKADSYKDRREDYYRRACNNIGEESFKCFAIAAAMGYVPAERGLGRCYELGVGTKVDRPRAFHWYRSAVTKGHLDASIDLGRCYAEGIGTAFDLKLAIKHLTVAERLGSGQAHEIKELLLKRKLKKMTRSLYSSGMELLHQKKFEAAIRVIEAAAELGYPKAVYTLGCFLEFGIGVPCDRERAFDLYEQAYAGKFRDPRQNYKLQVLRMIR